MPNPTDNTPYLFITTVVVPLSGVIGVIGKTVYDHFTKKKQLQVDDGTQLRKDLLEERKTLLNQLLSERNFYSDKMEKLEARVDELEKTNGVKDTLILEQRGKLNEQELQIHSQMQLIAVLQAEIDSLRADKDAARLQAPSQQ